MNYVPFSNKEFPAKLKSCCVNQIDHILSAVDAPELIAVPALASTVNGHLSTSAVLDMVFQLESMESSWVSISQVPDSNRSFLCVSENGDSFVLSKIRGDRYFLQKFYKPSEEIECFWVTYEEMTKGLGILPQVLSITKKQPQSALSQPLLAPPSKSADDDSAAVQER